MPGFARHIEKMTRREFAIRAIHAVVAAFAVPACARSEQVTSSPPTATPPVEPLVKSHREWRAILDSKQYGVLFEEDTESPFSSSLNEEKRKGTFVCAACGLPLFASSTKFESGTGWPSFYQPLAGSVTVKTDYMLLYPRTEYHCTRCGGHQGHVFKDGPPPTGQRWCNNGVALQFVLSGEPLPELRQ